VKNRRKEQEQGAGIIMIRLMNIISQMMMRIKVTRIKMRMRRIRIMEGNVTNMKNKGNTENQEDEDG